MTHIKAPRALWALGAFSLLRYFAACLSATMRPQVSMLSFEGRALDMIGQVEIRILGERRDKGRE